nr:DUF1043 family protein [Pseudomonas sp. NW5]
MLPVLGLLAGIVIGFLLARLLTSSHAGSQRHRVDEMQERFESYQNEVANHFNTTANLLQKLNQNYQDIHEHLSEGASRLAVDEQTRQLLTRSLATPTARTLPASSEPPRDYAPGHSGVLSDEPVVKHD